jgi:ribosome-associated protein
LKNTAAWKAKSGCSIEKESWSSRSGFQKTNSAAGKNIPLPIRKTMVIPVNAQITLPENEVTMEFVRASGPGGQNVNKVATAVKLYFHIGRSPSLPEAVKRRLQSLAGKRVNGEGFLIIDARRFRTQEANRRDALERLVKLIRQAATVPKSRRPTRPGAGAKARRIEEKKKHGATKLARKKTFPNDN